MNSPNDGPGAKSPAHNDDFPASLPVNCNATSVFLLLKYMTSYLGAIPRTGDLVAEALKHGTHDGMYRTERKLRGIASMPRAKLRTLCAVKLSWNINI
jgi:hypothetical protein